ncbi:MAG TPA: helix-turn-helix domain-containing protein [Novosphingobium sp.]|nr:helix-turn-helix domain-containing protein [Novosphingobium sp.]
MAAESTITVHFFRPSAPLQAYFTAFYLTEIETPPGSLVDDYLHPEWAALRFTQGTPPVASVGPGPLVPQWPFVANGPTSKTIHFGVETSRIWGIGLQPAGWAKFVPAPAHTLANVTVDGTAHPAFVHFAPLAGRIFDRASDPAAEAARIDAHLMTLIELPVPHEAQIAACHAAVLDPEISTVAALRDRLDLPLHSLERLTRRYFGFSPQLLLRRQRFLRSLAQFMLDPQRNWSGALDGQYHDQAQFVRDFRNFMGLSPRQYAALPHPILNPIMRQRMTDAGALEPIDLPTVARYAD